MAMIEVVPILVIFVILCGYSFGLFGVIHTGILNSIGARNYVFETFRNRSDLTVFRTNNWQDPNHYRNRGNRFGLVESEDLQTETNGQFPATERPLAKGLSSYPKGVRDPATHQQVISQDISRRPRVGVAPVWIQVGYGICLNARCGD